MRRSRVLVALVLSLALGTAACGSDDDDAAPPRTDTTSASPSPSATPSWSATAKPQRPADEFTEEGAEAFAVFAADTVLYMMATGDVPALTSIADLATCTSCQGWVDNYDSGKIEKLTVSSGPARHELVDEPSVNDEVYYQVRLALDIPPGESVRKDTGKKIAKVKAAEALPFKTNIQWKGDQWQLLTYDLG